MNTKNKHVVFLTGAGMSAESGIKTFRGNDGLWENYPVMQVASHEGWLADPNLVNQFYNERRQQLFAAQPNKGHQLIAELEKRCQVTVNAQARRTLSTYMANCSKSVPRPTQTIRVTSAR